MAGWIGVLAPVAIGFGLAVFLAGTAPVERLRNIVFDQYLRAAPRAWSPDLPVRIIDVDDASLARLGQWPWPRRVIAELTDKLAQNGAAVIAYDVVFAEPDRYAPGAILDELPASPEREALRAALEAQGKLAVDPLALAFSRASVVAATALVSRPMEAFDPRRATKSNFVILGDDPTPLAPSFPAAVLPLPELMAAASGLGAINYVSDGDQIIRRGPLVFALGPAGRQALVPSFAVEALRVAFQTDTPIIKSTNASGERVAGGHSAIVAVKVGDAEFATDADGSVRIRYAGEQSGRRLPAWKVLAGEVERDEIDGRIMLVGTSAAALADIRATPLNPSTPGVEVHAELLEHVLTGARLVRPDWAPGAEGFVILLGGVLVAWAARRFRPAPAAGALLAALAASGLGSWLLFTRADLLLDPLVPGASWIATYIAGTLLAYRRAESERRYVRSAFQRYLSPEIVEQIAADPSRLRLGGETRETTVLFSDVRDFTSRAELLDAEGVVRFLNALHTPLTAAVLAHGGTIDKYIGDGLMAFWNAPLDAPDHADRACAAALAMQEAALDLDSRMAREAAANGAPHLPVRIGIGLSTGLAFVGNMGSEQRLEYSMVGDTVNIAARLEAGTKDIGASIIVSEATAKTATSHLFVPLGDLLLRGRARAEPIFALHTRKSAQTNEFNDFLKLHEDALIAIEQRLPTATATIAATCATGDGVRYAAFYKRRLAGLKPALEAGKNPGGS
ncbi:MAG: adenylate/guanylate cyclase domain-containing protein [Beijerinckiaceae bacterium]|nr:adenylate/guanylate cyclase domain-containing protein [Beijerinckiaceae bacterium]